MSSAAGKTRPADNIRMVTIAPERGWRDCFHREACRGRRSSGNRPHGRHSRADSRCREGRGEDQHAPRQRLPCTTAATRQLHLGTTGERRLWASIIPDGHHLPPAVVKCIVRAKGVARTLLTCDAGSLAGMPPGKYREWDTDLEVLPSGKIVVAGTPFLAGSGHFTDTLRGNVMRLADVTLAEAIDIGNDPRRGNCSACRFRRSRSANRLI